MIFSTFLTILIFKISLKLAKNYHLVKKKKLLMLRVFKSVELNCYVRAF